MPHLRSDKRTLSLLHQCRRLSAHHLKSIHARLLISGTISDAYAAGKLLAHNAISDLRYAHLLLLSLPNTTNFIWNTLLAAHAHRHQPLPALSLYRQMLAAGRLPNNYTFSFLLRACIDLPSLLTGRNLHTHITRLGWESYDFVQNGLIHMYATCGCVSSARNLFDKSSTRDVVSWTAMVHGHVKARQMDDAGELFDRMPVRNAVSWSVMITAYAQVGMFREALDLFNEMQVSGVRPNHAGIVGALSACGFLGALDQGKWVHAFAERNGMELDGVLGTALVDMYAKCGCIETAWQVFDEMPDRDVFAYTTMISGFSNHGDGKRAIDLFDKMQREGVRPNEVTFVCVISACSRMGSVEQGRELFESMTSVYGIEPGVEHYGCMVDLLGRAGLLEEARRVVTEMPMEPDSYVLGALLNACRVHGEVNLGKETVETLKGLGLDHSGAHVLMSNMYASTDRWEDVMAVRKGMEEKQVRKMPGCSMIEIDGVVCEFVAGDKSHLFMEEIIPVLKGVDKQLKSLDEDVYAIGSEEGLV